MTSTTVNSTDPAISLIVPVYNVGPYIAEGLQSLLQQDFAGSYEVILVDDGSTDNSLEICREFANQHPDKFRLIESPANAGVSAARNLGLEQARGDYFMFFDPDDLLFPDTLRGLYSEAESQQVDIVKGNNTIFRDGEEKSAHYNVRHRALIKGDAVLTTLYAHDRVRGHPWGKMFNRAQLGHERFPEGVRMAQDLYYCARVFAEARSLLLIEQQVYRYRLRPGGSTGRKFETGAYLDWFRSVEEIGKFAHNSVQARMHKGLQLRTLVQAARECRKVDVASASTVLQVIERKCAEWNIDLANLFLRDKLGLRDLARYIKLRLALRQVRARLAEAGS